MESKRGILTVLVVTAVVVLAFLPCLIAQDNSDTDQPQDRPRIQRPGGERQGFRSDERGGRGGPGGDRQGRGGRPERPGERGRRPELTDEEIDSVLKEFTKRDPNTAKELAELRQKDPNEFRNELRRNAWPEISKIIMSSWAERIQNEFLAWLEKYVPKEAEELTRLKKTDTDLYTQKYELTWRKYDRIYDQRWNPELTKVLVTDLQLHERQRELQNKYRTAEAGEEKNELESQLEEVVSDRYNLLVRQKQLEYEQLLKRLEALQNEVRASLKEIETWLDKEFKEKTVKERMEFLTSEERRQPRIEWNDR